MTNRLSAPAADPAAAVAAAAVWWRECHRLHATAPCPAAAPDRHGQQAGVLRAQECGWQNQPRAAALRRARFLCTRPRRSARRARGLLAPSVVDFHPVRHVRAPTRRPQRQVFGKTGCFTPNVKCVICLEPSHDPTSQKLREYNRTSPATLHQRPREGGADWRMARPSTAKARGSARVGLSACAARQLLLLARRSRVAMPP